MSVKFFPENSFDTPNARTREEIYRSIYKHRDEDLSAACKKAHGEGVTLGDTKAKESIEAKTNAICTEINEKLEIIRREESQRNDALFLNAITIAQTVTKKLLPVWEEKHGLEEIKAIVNKALEVAREKAKIEIWVNPDIVEKLKEHMEKDIPIHKDTNLSHADCRVEWQTGGFEKNMRVIWENIDKVLDAYLAQATTKPFIENPMEEEHVG